MNSQVRIIGEGTVSYKLLDFSIKHNGFVSSTILYAQKPGISDKLIYHYLIPRALNNNNATIIFIVNQPEHLPIDPQPDLLFESVIDNSMQFKPGRMYKVQASNQDISAKILSKLRLSIFPRHKESNPLIFIVDTSTKWSSSLENELRRTIREAPLNNVSVWLHSPIQLIPSDLIASIGNVAVIWPSNSELELLKYYLPNDKFDLSDSTLLRGMLFFSSLLCGEKGWEFTEFGTPD